MTGTTVRRWVTKRRLSSLASFRTWQLHRYHEAIHPVQSVGLSVVVNRVRTDATNAKIWQKRKLSVLELQSAFTVRPIMPTEPWPGTQELFETRKVLAPLKAVGDSTGRGCLGILDKQMENIRAIGWPRPADAQLAIEGDCWIDRPLPLPPPPPPLPPPLPPPAEPPAPALADAEVEADGAVPDAADDFNEAPHAAVEAPLSRGAPTRSSRRT